MPVIITRKNVRGNVRRGRNFWRPTFGLLKKVGNQAQNGKAGHRQQGGQFQVRVAYAATKRGAKMVDIFTTFEAGDVG